MTDAFVPPVAPQAPADRARWTSQTVRATHGWTDALLSFRISRDPTFRFAPGQYARLGLAGPDGVVVWRPFSMVSSPAEPDLEFVATLVPGGAFSTLLAGVRPGDAMLVDRSTFGFLTVDRVAPGQHLWMLASGTGLGPFMSMLRDATAWQAFEALVLVHSVRQAADLAYRAEIEALARGGSPSGSSGGAPPGAEPELAAPSRARLHYLPVVTRQAVPGLLGQRIPQLLEQGSLQAATGLPLEVEPSRILVCGNPEMSTELRRLLVSRGFTTPRRGLSGQMAFENYW